MTLKEIQEMESKLKTAREQFKADAGNMTEQVEEIAKQLESAKSAMDILCSIGGVEPSAILGNERISGVLQSFQLPKVKTVRVQMTVDGVQQFIGVETKLGKEIADNFGYSKGYVKNWMSQHPVFSSTRQVVGNERSPLIYSVAPQVAGKGGKKK